MIVLAVDLGKARTGLAVCDPCEILASPLAVLHEGDPDRLAEAIVSAAKERGAQLLVLGLPRNMDGSEGESAQNARVMGEKLHRLSGLPVEFCDERGTTITAQGYLNDVNVRGKKRKNTVDAVAATVILEDFLRSRRQRRTT